jgi:hypothetical protein
LRDTSFISHKGAKNLKGRKAYFSLFAAFARKALRDTSFISRKGANSLKERKAYFSLFAAFARALCVLCENSSLRGRFFE